jgi:hypothetical protein
MSPIFTSTTSSQRSPDERSDIRDFRLLLPHIAALMRATRSTFSIVNSAVSSRENGRIDYLGR